MSISLRVLVVDAEEDFLRSIVMRIELRGFQVQGVASGDDAIAHLKDHAHQIDVVLLDIKMPGTLRQIKSCCPSIEVIVITGHASQEFNRLGREFGAFDYLTKPVKVDLLIEKIREAYRRGSGERLEGGAETLTDKLQVHMIVVDRLPQRPVVTKTDPFQLRQVLLNLITNAVQAIGNNGNVEIRVDQRTGRAVIGVIDDGPGIAEDHIERIFEPFFTTKDEAHGTGLGLAVSRGIVEKLGGVLEVENRPGEGCTFRLTLPLGSD